VCVWRVHTRIGGAVPSLAFALNAAAGATPLLIVGIAANIGVLVWSSIVAFKSVDWSMSPKPPLLSPPCTGGRWRDTLLDHRASRRAALRARTSIARRPALSAAVMEENVSEDRFDHPGSSSRLMMLPVSHDVADGRQRSHDNRN
jgi:hypothetical protein